MCTKTKIPNLGNKPPHLFLFPGSSVLFQTKTRTSQSKSSSYRTGDTIQCCRFMSHLQSFIPVHVGQYRIRNNPVSGRSRVEGSQVGIRKSKPRVTARMYSSLNDRPRVSISNIHVRAPTFKEEQSYSVGVWLEDTLFANSAFALAKVWIVVHKSDLGSCSLRSFLNSHVDDVNQVIVHLAAVVVKRPSTKYSQAREVALVGIGVEKFGIACNIDTPSGSKLGSQVVEEHVEGSWEDIICVYPTFRNFAIA
jgi:hypothetical protein